MEKDIRWQQRFSNFMKAYIQLEKAVEMEIYSELERDGLIHRFSYTYELAWNTIKDYLQNQGYQNITGSKDAIRQVFQTGLILIQDAEEWFEMLESRKLTIYYYDEETALNLAEKIKKEYFYMFEELKKKLSEKIQGDLSSAEK